MLLNEFYEDYILDLDTLYNLREETTALVATSMNKNNEKTTESKKKFSIRLKEHLKKIGTKIIEILQNLWKLLKKLADKLKPILTHIGSILLNGKVGVTISFDMKQAVNTYNNNLKLLGQYETSLIKISAENIKNTDFRKFNEIKKDIEDNFVKAKKEYFDKKTVYLIPSFNKYVKLVFEKDNKDFHALRRSVETLKSKAQSVMSKLDNKVSDEDLPLIGRYYITIQGYCHCCTIFNGYATTMINRAITAIHTYKRKHGTAQEKAEEREN